MFRGDLFDRPFGSLFRDIEREMADFDRRFEQMRNLALKQGQGSKPLVYGWTMHVGPDGVPHVQHFGNTGETEALEEGWREPFVTSFVDEDKDLVRITAELPGVDKDTIEVEAYDHALRIQATGEDRRYRTEVPVDPALDTATADASYNNGILEVTVQLAESLKPKGTKVDVR
ncbi:MAG: archaeal heat shock protein Hsp20 [Candidatus Thermoplasmatota archaeon]|nr:archaeal heat shock protein Hsp20 [Candidatus Thermoplasmatota archaeon]